MLWERLSGTQAVPPVWVVVVSGLAALVVVLTGRRLEGIRLHSDTSGETVSRGRGSGPGMVLTAAAGYVTPPLLGAGAAVLLFTHHVTLLLWAFLVLLVACFAAMRNAYGVLVALVAGGAVFGVTAFASALVQALFSYGVAWFLLFGGLRPVAELARSRRRPVRRRRGGMSDADQLARLTGVPGGVWVGVFAVIALVAIVVGARLLEPDRARTADPVIAQVATDASLDGPRDIRGSGALPSPRSGSLPCARVLWEPVDEPSPARLLRLSLRQPSSSDVQQAPQGLQRTPPECAAPPTRKVRQ